MFNVKATTFLFHLLLQPISIYCNGVVTHQFQGLDEGRSRQLHEGLHDTCGFHVSLTTQVIHWQHTLARTILKDSPGPSYRPWLVIHQHLHATYWWCSSIGEREEFMTTSSNWASCEWVSGDAIGPPEVLLGKKVLCALVMLLELTGQRQCNNAQLLCFFLKSEHWPKKMVQLLAALADLKTTWGLSWKQEAHWPTLGSLVGWEGKLSPTWLKLDSHSYGIDRSAWTRKFSIHL